MTRMAARQNAFAAALSGDDAPFAAAPGLAERLAVYRRSIEANECRALRLAFPVIAALVGDAFFEALARAHAAAAPSCNGDLQQRGASLPGFLVEWAPARGLPYLADVARLEWQVHRARFAADLPPITSAHIAGSTPQALLAQRMGLAPACAWIASTHPVAAIWRWQQRGDAAPRLDGHAQTALVLRRGWDVDVVAASTADIAALGTLRDGGTLGKAVAAAFGAEPAFDAGAAMLRWLGWELLTEPDAAGR